MTDAQLINQTSGEQEYYTPDFIINAARLAMGEINLDPASSRAGNTRVGADRYFDIADNGLIGSWECGALWMNHPFGRVENPKWITKLINEFIFGNFRESCNITYACTSEEWFQPLAKYPQCYLSPRTNYILPDGTVKRGVTKGSVVTYLGPNVDRFGEAFKNLGVVKVPWQK